MTTSPQSPLTIILETLELLHSSLTTYRDVGAFTPGQPSSYLIHRLEQAIQIAKSLPQLTPEAEGDNQDEALPGYRDVGHPPTPPSRDPLPSDFPPPSGTKGLP